MTDCFPADYAASRTAFRDAAARAGFTLEAHPLGIDTTGPDGKALTVDVAVRPAESADAPCLLLSSGLHGIEGFFGAAVQRLMLERWATQPPPTGLRCVLAHALNPFGFAQLRRANEDNIDLNRSFLLPGQELVTPPGYATLDPLLNPRRPPSRWEPFLLKVLLAILRAGGKAPVKQAVAGGQYDFPQGLFYGGRGQTATGRILDQHLPGWTGGSPRVIHLDFHTGLGRSGTCKLLIDYRPDARQLATLRRLFDPGALELLENPAAGVAYQTSGSLGAWCVARCAPAEYVYACAEFGTYADVRVLAALRAENQAHCWAAPGSPVLKKARHLLKEMFCPAGTAWRKQVLDESENLVANTVAGLCDGSSKNSQPWP